MRQSVLPRIHRERGAPIGSLEAGPRRRRDGGERATDYGLTAGTLGSTAAQTVMVAVFPVLLAEHAPSTLWVGLAVGSEGLLALLVPYWVGLASDHLPRRLIERFGRRIFFMIVSAPIMAVTMALVPFLSGYWVLFAAAVVFFAALNVYLTPLWTLMIDRVPEERWGRVQGIRGVFHSAGLAYGLIAGGLLLALWRPLPFLLGGLLVIITTVLTCVAAHRQRGKPQRDEREPPTAWKDVKQSRAARWFLIGNALWTGGVDGLRPYFFLFAVAVIGLTVAQASLVLLLLVVGLGLGAALLGRVGDRYDRGRLLQLGLIVTGCALLPGLFVRGLWAALPLLLIAGVGAAAVMTLPYPVYAELVDERAMGRATGIYIVSLGFGRLIAPIVVGAAIDFGEAWLPEQEGYPLMWPVAGLFMLAGALALARARRAEGARA